MCANAKLLIRDLNRLKIRILSGNPDAKSEKDDGGPVNRRHLIQLFIFEILAAMLAVASFRAVESRWTAGIIAGTGFLLLGGWGVWISRQWPDRFRSLSYYLIRVHLWVISLPMVATRLWLGVEGDFSQAYVLGIPAGTFHRLSEWVYLLLILATIADYFRTRRHQL